MNLTIHPSRLCGAVTPPQSKSRAHRLMIAAALAGGESVIENFAFSEDLCATLRGIEALGASWSLSGSTLRVCGIAPCGSWEGELPRIDCGESGSTLRFLLPVTLAVAGGGVFTGGRRLMERPLQPYFDLLCEKGIFYSLENDTLTVRGKLPAGEYTLPGNISSQFFTGLFLALPLLDAPSVIIPAGEIESFGYVLMTLQTLDEFGIQIPAALSLPPRYYVPGGAEYHPRHLSVEADWSQAAFWYAAARLGGAVTLCGMNEHSLQGDRAILDLGERIEAGGSVSIDISGCPDLAPPLAVLGAVMNGELRLTGAARLRLKESDRLAAITRALSALGAQVHEESDSLLIRGKKELVGGITVDCENDHRIAMMIAIAATRCTQPVTLVGAQCVNKSYPGFWQDYEALGGIIYEHSGQ